MPQASCFRPGSRGFPATESTKSIVTWPLLPFGSAVRQNRVVSDLALNALARDELVDKADFANPAYGWRRLLSEILGTFFLVLVAAGGGMMAVAFPGTVSRAAAVVAPGLMVMAIILFMGKISGAHLNPAVSFAFALRGDFPWRRVIPYVLAQIVGAVLAVVVLQSILGVSASNGATYPAAGSSDWAGLAMEIVLTLGLVSVILGTASGAQNIGPIGALAVGGYIALAGLWASPLEGASMNPVRSFAPDLIANDFTAYWIYLVGPFVGASIAVVLAYALRGPGGGPLAREAAEGSAAVRREKLLEQAQRENAASNAKNTIERDVDDIDAWIHRRNRAQSDAPVEGEAEGKA